VNQTELLTFAERFLDAWNSQDVERVVACYTEDVQYRDPNTRGMVEGARRVIPSIPPHLPIPFSCTCIKMKSCQENKIVGDRGTTLASRRLR